MTPRATGHPRPATPLLILMGLRGCGKSTVLRLLPSRLDPAPAAIDLDDAVAARAGATSVADLWNCAGEPAFRQLESAALGDLLSDPARGPTILALGGGTPTAPGAADLLRRAVADRRATILYLRADPAILRARLAATDAASRPPLLPDAGGRGDPLAEIDRVFAVRDPLYRALASAVIDASIPASAVADEALRLWSSAASTPSAPPPPAPTA